MSDSAKVMETLWLTKDFPAYPLGYLLGGLHPDLLMLCSECVERAKRVGLQTDTHLGSLSLGLVLAVQEIYNRVKKHRFHIGV